MLISLQKDQESDDNGKRKKEFVRITISDNGVGIPENIDIEDAKTLGMTIVNLLCKQLNGEITINREKGTKVTLLFPMQE